MESSERDTTLRTVLCCDYETPNIYRWPGNDFNIVYHDKEQKLQRFSFDEIQWYSKCQEQPRPVIDVQTRNCTFLVCDTQVPKRLNLLTLPCPLNVKQMAGCTLYFYAGNTCVVYVHVRDAASTTLLYTFGNVIRALLGNAMYVPYNEHLVTNFLRSEGYMKQGTTITVVVKISNAPPSSIRTAEQCHSPDSKHVSDVIKKVLRFVAGLQPLRSDYPTSKIIPYMNDCDASECVLLNTTHSSGAPCEIGKWGNSCERQLADSSSRSKTRGGSKNISEETLRENQELRDLVLKLSKQVDSTRNENRTLQENLVDLNFLRCQNQDLEARYAESQKEIREMKKKEIDRIRHNILSKAARTDLLEMKTKRDSSQTRDRSPPSPTRDPSSSLRGGLNATERTLKGQKRTIKELRCKLFGAEKELQQLQTRDWERLHVNQCPVILQVCRYIEIRIENIENMLEQISKPRQKALVTAELSFTLNEMRETLLHLCKRSSMIEKASGLHLGARDELHDLRLICHRELQSLASLLSLIDLVIKIEDALEYFERSSK